MPGGGSGRGLKATSFRKFCHYFCSNHGGILIEFAFSIPLILMLLFFVNDHYRIYELKNKCKGSTYMIASMLQNVHNTDNGFITIEDAKRITYAASLNLFHNNTMFSPWPLGICISCYIYYFKRISSSCYYGYYYHNETHQGSSPTSMYDSQNKYTYSSASELTKLHPNLVLEKDGDEKVYIKFFYYPASSLSDTSINKSNTGAAAIARIATGRQPNEEISSVSGDRHYNRSKLGLFLLDLPYVYSEKGLKAIVSELVFTPKPGIFAPIASPWSITGKYSFNSAGRKTWTGTLTFTLYETGEEKTIENATITEVARFHNGNIQYVYNGNDGARVMMVGTN